MKVIVRWIPERSMRAFKTQDGLIHFGQHMDEGIFKTGCDSPVGELIVGQSATLSCPTCVQKAQEIVIPMGADSGRV
ncbi:MAG: hypothetical protein A2842_00315 [Candidatus Wildermuthbacteria bacterium RIFCSPHIGHO2_01_FULL_48_25]|uniref:Uncharacterized protein n=1 Tax=Candidatus Wildermuthbacteria bacterium RIFCSPLOWO2_01_FULL_48_16 TaxID=1802461 RepID=A0A1G2RKI4_9BACT|nr:MAG: hypothetical protein A2842_00315 [Candidatus Wildermuthbacteria bacterium RIFCSPHIGHO2_01_FULL_48_25]OHA68343.1 MAG: hypothetical protein A3J57_02755 [Candidatus Wildermuthbacteria bacterium RIFCSPHIGHO2_02_FULL_49_12b]OHA73355.1 MAG: hypothetical protein A3B24_00410 [Candidatus Wildermuthbacteria bacterium RIFCSPLOWO2_01_FULL_48_16]